MSAYGLCQQMMHVFHQFRLYVTFEVMEPAWIGMQSSLDKAHTLDEVSAMPAFLQQIKWVHSRWIQSATMQVNTV